MAGRFMKIKKIVIPFMTLVIMTSQLAGCATMTSQEMLDSMNESPDVSIEWAVPDTGQQSLDASGVIDVGGTQFVADSDSDSDQDVGIIDQQQEVKELSGAELERYFQLAYDSGSAVDGDLETRISGELGVLVSLVDSDDAKLPGDYATQYRAWRPIEIAQYFTDCNETVWATGTVNLRNGPSTDGDKVGSLNKNDSVTRTGIGTGDYASWSRVVLSTGDIVYVSNSYLSTTKPVVQQQQQQQQQVSNNQQEKPVEQQPAAETQKPAEQQPQQSTNNQVELTPEGQAILDHLRETDPNFYIDEEGALHSAAANGTTGKIMG